MSEVISSFRSLRAGSQVFALLMLFLCVILHTMCCACGPNEHISAPSICVVCVFVCRKLSPHLGVWELDHGCLLSLCYFFV